MEKLIKYFKLQKEIYDYFDYSEDWVVYPMEDQTDMWWSIVDENFEEEFDITPDGRKVSCDYGPNTLFTTHSLENHISLVKHNWGWDKAGVGEDCYSFEIHLDRFLKKSIFKGEEYTMILVDTHVDGNKFLSVFDNNKKVSRSLIRKKKLEKIDEV